MSFASLASPLPVDMIGPVPADWGGLKRHGGVATHVQGLVRVLPASDVQVRLLADNTDARQQAAFPDRPPQVAIHTLARSAGTLAGLGWGRIARLAWRLFSRAELRAAAPPRQLLRFLGQAANFDHFLAASPADLLHVHHAEYRQFLCQQVVGASLPLVATVHSVSVLVRPHPAWLVAMVLANYRRADRLIAVSHFVRHKIEAQGVDPARIAVIPNGVDIQVFRPASQPQARTILGMPVAGRVILFAGRLASHKGLDVLLRAFQQMAAQQPAAHLVIVGSGPDRESLQALAADLGIIDRVTFAGQVQRRQMPLWYQACDLLVLPSWAEGLSVAILEALASGRPVITNYPDGSAHDAVIDGETGLLCRYGDVAELATALATLAAAPELTARMGLAARALAERAFSWDVVGRQTADLYRAALAEKRQPRD